MWPWDNREDGQYVTRTKQIVSGIGSSLELTERAMDIALSPDRPETLR